MTDSWDGQQRLKLAPDVLLEKFDAEALLINLNADTIFQLNETGARIVELVTKELPIEAVVTILKREFSSQASEIEQHVFELIDQLMQEKLVMHVE